MDTGENKALARRWFDSTSYRVGLKNAETSGNPKEGREFYFGSLIAEIFSPNCIMHFPDGDGRL